VRYRTSSIYPTFPFLSEFLDDFGQESFLFQLISGNSAQIAIAPLADSTQKRAWPLHLHEPATGDIDGMD
jgi:hypothetical protein